MKYILRLSDIERVKESALQVGGKAYNLGLLMKKGFNIPDGFVLTTEAYYEFLSHNKLEERIREKLRKTKKENLTLQSLLIKSELMSGTIPLSLEEEIEEEIKRISSLFYAVRSSAIGEDSIGASFAGVYDSYLGVLKGDLFTAIKRCWASLYNPSAIFLRLEKKLPLEGAMGVIIQKMVNSKVSGVAFSYSNECIIEATWGLGTLLVSGKVEPDIYVIDKNGFILKEKKVGNKNLKAILTHRGVVLTRVRTKKYCLSNRQAVSIARLFPLLERVFGLPLDIEWTLASNELFILQTRSFEVNAGKRLIADSPFSYVPAPIIRGKAFIERMGEKDSILVLHRAEPRFVPFLKYAKAVICEQGGVLNHLAILCRELGIPYFVMENAAQMIKDGDFIEVVMRDREKVVLRRIERRKWRKIMSFIPSPPPPSVKDFFKKAAKNLPCFIDKAYSLEVQVRKDGIYVSEDSLSKFIADIEEDLCILYENLRTYGELPEWQKASLPILSSIIVEPLFEKLSTMTGSRNVALKLIEGVEPLYLILDRKELWRYLQRFGTKVKIPTAVKRKAQQGKKDKVEIEKFAKNLFDTQQIEKLSSVIKTLIQAYEAKDLMDFYCLRKEVK